jgi:hypothetical protein
VKSIPPGDDKITPVKEGEAAPFDGQLFSPETALRWANWLEQYRLRLDEDLRLQTELCAIEINYRDQRRELEEEANAKIEEDLRARLLAAEQENVELQEELHRTPWHKTRTFGIVLGVVGTSLVAGATGWVVIQARD